MPHDVKIPTGNQGKVANDPSWSPLRCEKLITFDGGTSDAWGDKDGDLKAGAVFTVTGTVRLRVIGIVETTLVGAGKVELGVTGGTAKLLAQVADASGMAIGEIWHDATVDSLVENASVASEKIVSNGLDIILTQSVADITAGAVRFLVSWYPLSKGAKVVPSSN